MNFAISTFPTAKRERSINACLRCRSLHKKCVVLGKDSTCELCRQRNTQCEWGNTQLDNHKKKKIANNYDESVFARMFRDNDHTKPQFVCSTQPLALLLSRDSVLCFDGDAYGLYFPWTRRETSKKDTDPDLQRYLERKGAFNTPSISEQRYLVKLYLDNLYPIYPVVSRNILDHIQETPLILLNAIFLSAVRFDKKLDSKDIRGRLAEFFERCKLLEAVETNKIVLIQAFILLSMHEEGIEGMTLSKQYVSKATNLCGELAITNMGGSMEEYLLNESNPTESSIQYSKQLLSRIIWCTFCIDRMISATCGREMIFNRADLILNPIDVMDFDSGAHQETDFQIFSSWLEICELIERIQCSLYRPPNNRSIDHNLFEDIKKWRSPHFKTSSSTLNKFVVFLNTSHCYTNLLFLRCKIDSISILLGDENPGECIDVLNEIHSCSELVLKLVNPCDLIHHVLIVHAILHVIALLQLEYKVQPENLPSDSLFSKYYQQASRTSVSKLKELKDHWWFAGTALVLCQNVFDLD